MFEQGRPFSHWSAVAVTLPANAVGRTSPIEQGLASFREALRRQNEQDPAGHHLRSEVHCRYGELGTLVRFIKEVDADIERNSKLLGPELSNLYRELVSRDLIEPYWLGRKAKHQRGRVSLERILERCRKDSDISSEKLLFELVDTGFLVFVDDIGGEVRIIEFYPEECVGGEGSVVVRVEAGLGAAISAIHEAVIKRQPAG